MIRVLVEGISQMRAGIGSMIMAIYRGIDKSQIQFDFIIPQDSVYEKEIKQLGGRCYTFPRWMRSPIKYNKKFKELIKNNEYDFFWMHSSSKLNIRRFKSIKNNSKTKIITHSHGTKNEYTGWKGLICPILEKFNERYFYKYLDFPFACSEAAADYYYDKKKLKEKKVVIINNTIELDCFKYDQKIREIYRKELNIENKKVLLMAGRLVPIKNTEFTVRMLKKLVDKDSSYLLMLAGDGPEKENILKLSKELGIEENIRLLGNRNDIEKIYLAADYLLMPSFNEGFPVAIIEAQASGLRCYISDNITREVSLCNEDKEKTCVYLKLDIDCWKDAILNDSQNERKSISEKNISILREKGYDSKEYPIKFLEMLKGLK